MKFDTCQQLINDCAANTPQEFFRDLTQTMDLWMREFGGVDDGLMTTAVKMHLTSAKAFPTVAEIKTNIRELRRDLSQKSPTPRSTEMSAPVRKVLDMVLKGDIGRAVAEMDITRELEFARTVFPNISDDIVRRNFCEISAVLSESEMCRMCLVLPTDCLSKGYVQRMSLTPGGVIETTVIRCRKRQPGYGEPEGKAG